MSVKRKRRYPHVSSFTDRHGKVRWRWRKTGFATHYFRNPPDTAGFKEELTACEAGNPIRAGEGRCIPRSIADLVSRYYGSTNFNGGGADDQRRRRLLIESFRGPFADDLVSNFRWDHIEAILAERAKKTVKDGRAVGGPLPRRACASSSGGCSPMPSGSTGLPTIRWMMRSAFMRQRRRASTRGRKRTSPSIRRATRWARALASRWRSCCGRGSGAAMRGYSARSS